MDETDETLKLRGDVKIPTPILLKRMLSYAKGSTLALIVAFIFLLINVGLNLILPMAMEWFVNLYSPENFGETTLAIILGTAIGYGGIVLINQVFRFFENLILQRAGQKIVYNLRMEVFSHIESMSQNQFNEMPVGSLVTRVANYTAALSNLFTDVLLNVLSNLITIVAVFVIMAIKSWQLSLALLGFAIVIGIISFFFGGQMGKKFREERKCVSDLNTFLSEHLSGMKIVQIFNQEEKKHTEFAEKNEKLRKSAYGVNFAFTFYRPVISFLYFAAIAVTFGMGYSLHFNAGMVVAFYLYLSHFFQPIQAFADQLHQITHALTSCERLFNLMDVPPEVVDSPDAVPVEHFKGKIEFQNVWFAYEKDNWILRDVSFTVEAGQTAAFVGVTGAGKTTILSLIVRNYSPQKGRILIDGRDIETIQIDSLRRGIGQMLQDVFLFSGTIENNITLRDPSFTQEQIKEATDYVGATPFIEKTEKGFQTEVSERGENFSAGQRQLLSFARTVLHKPQILILDEATANIDTETEQVIQASLLKMASIGTMLIVAHRLSTIQHADNIIVLQNGTILEQGNHQALLKKKGYYHRLYTLQFDGGAQ